MTDCRLLSSASDLPFTAPSGSPSRRRLIIMWEIAKLMLDRNIYFFAALPFAVEWVSAVSRSCVFHLPWNHSPNYARKCCGRCVSQIMLENISRKTVRAHTKRTASNDIAAIFQFSSIAPRVAKVVQTGIPVKEFFNPMWLLKKVSSQGSISLAFIPVIGCRKIHL